MWISIALLGTILTAPTPPPTIVTVRSTFYCDAMADMALPIGYLNRVNSNAFAAMEQPVVDVVTSTRGLADLTRELPISQIDQLLYSAGNTVSMAKINQITWEIDQNLALEDRYMNDSWKRFPKGTDPGVDAMRQRLQNLIDLQNAMDNAYTQLAEGYFDNSGGGGSIGGTAQQMILGQIAALAAAESPSSSGSRPQQSVHDIAKFGNEANIARELTLQELAFGQEVVAAADDCGYDLKK